MLKNYIKIALKVFWRHKFFTAVNLFGICFTLVVLMVAVTFFDQEVGPIPPEVHADRTLYLSRLFVQHTQTNLIATGHDAQLRVSGPLCAFAGNSGKSTVFSERRLPGLARRWQRRASVR